MGYILLNRLVQFVEVASDNVNIVCIVLIVSRVRDGFDMNLCISGFSVDNGISGRKPTLGNSRYSGLQIPS